MLEPRWRKVLRDTWVHRYKMALVVPAIVLGLVAAGSVLDTWALVDRAVREGFEASNPVAATLYTEDLDAALLARIRAMPEVAAAEARRTVGVTISTQLTSARGILYVSDDFAGSEIGRIKPEQGVWPPANGLVVERSSVDFGALTLGDPVRILAGGGDVSLEVTGIARDVGVAPGWMEHVIYGFVTPEVLGQLGFPTTLDELRLTVADSALDQAGVRRVAQRVKTVVESTGRKVTEVQVPVPGEHIHAGQMNSLLYTQGGFGALALVLSGFLVINLITAMLAGQVREIGVMKAIGARPEQLAGMYLALALALGLTATALALPASAAIGRAYGAFKAELLNFEVSGYAIPWWTMLLQAAVGILVPVAAAAIPVRRGAKLSVAAALRDFGIVDQGGRAPRAIRIGGVGRPLLLSIRNAFRQRQRMVLTLLTIAMGGALFLGARSLKQSIGRGVDLAFLPRRYQVLVQTAAPQDPDSLSAVIGRVAGVRGVEAWSGARVALLGRDGSLGNPFQLSAPPAATALLDPPVERGRWVEPGSRELVLAARLASAEGLALGDVATLVIDDDTTRWRVVGLGVSGAASTAGFADRDEVAGLLYGGLVRSAVVQVTAPGLASELELIGRIRSTLAAAGMPVSSTSRLEEARRVTEDHLLMVADFLGAMAWVILAVGGLALASTMGLAVLERTREIGVLRSIGARHRSIVGIVLAEAQVIGLASWLVAIPLSVPMSLVLELVFSKVMLKVPPTYLPEGTGVGIWLGLVVVVAAIAAGWPAYRATRVTTRAALAYE